MAQRLFLVKNSSPIASWYKVYASGDEDPDIYAGFLLEQFKKYSKTNVKIIYTLDCDDSARTLERFYDLIARIRGGDNPVRIAEVHAYIAETNNWICYPVETIREHMRESIKK